jgi:hypothetical protein
MLKGLRAQSIASVTDATSSVPSLAGLFFAKACNDLLAVTMRIRAGAVSLES